VTYQSIYGSTIWDIEDEEVISRWRGAWTTFFMFREFQVVLTTGQAEHYA